jgi:hypothetical protein
MAAARKESMSDARIEEELEEVRPFYVIVMSIVLKLVFLVYDAIVYRVGQKSCYPLCPYKCHILKIPFYRVAQKK